MTAPDPILALWTRFGAFSAAMAVPGVMWNVRQAIHKVGLRYHKEKSFYDRPAEITGVIVDGDKLKLPNRNLKKSKGLRKDLLTCEDMKQREKLTQKAAGIRGQRVQLERVLQEQVAR